GIGRGVIQRAHLTRVVAFLADLQIGAYQGFGRQLRDGELQGLRGAVEALVADRMTAGASGTARIDLGGSIVVEGRRGHAAHAAPSIIPTTGMPALVTCTGWSSARGNAHMPKP